MVEKSRRRGLQACRCWLFRERETVRLDGHTWKVYHCRRGHVTRVLVKP